MRNASASASARLACPVHPCPWPAAPGHLPMCPWHWRMVPAELAAAVRLAFGPLELAAAQAAAIAAVRRQVAVNRLAPAIAWST